MTLCYEDGVDRAAVAATMRAIAHITFFGERVTRVVVDRDKQFRSQRSRSDNYQAGVDPEPTLLSVRDREANSGLLAQILQVASC